MSYPIITLPKGVTFKYTKTPKFSNIKQQPQSGRHPAAATIQQGTVFEFDINWNYLKNNGVTTANDQQYLQEFFEAVGGGFAFFEFNPALNDLESLTVTEDYTQLQNGFFAQGDGSTTVFPLWRSTSALGGGLVTTVERIQNVTALTGIYSDGTIVSGADYTTSNWPATVTFGSAPAGGANLSWAGSYDYLCQFAQDTCDFDEFLFQLWSLKSLKLESVNL